jgi:N4-gp56 family major capsid protein
MADTEVLTTAAEAAKRWATRVRIEAVREIYWGKFMRENDMNVPIEVARDLEGQPGDELTFTLARKLTGAGVEGDETLENNEEPMQLFSDTLRLRQVRNAVRLRGRLSERRTAFDQRMTAKNLLKTWLAETIDDDIFTQFDTSPHSSRVKFGGDATSTAAIDAGDTITVAKIESVVAAAQKATPKIWPVRVDEGDFYVFVMHTDVGYDLRQSQQWLDASQEAGPRDYGRNNIFTGRLGIVGGVVCHAHEKVPVSTTYGSNGDLPGASNLFVGRQAGLFAWGARPEWWEERFDYGGRIGFAIGAIWDFKKAVYNGVDNAFFAVRTYRTNN